MIKLWFDLNVVRQHYKVSNRISIFIFSPLKLISYDSEPYWSDNDPIQVTEHVRNEEVLTKKRRAKWYEVCNLILGITACPWGNESDICTSAHIPTSALSDTYQENYPLPGSRGSWTCSCYTTGRKCVKEICYSRWISRCV